MYGLTLLCFCSTFSNLKSTDFKKLLDDHISQLEADSPCVPENHVFYKQFKEAVWVRLLFIKLKRVFDLINCLDVKWFLIYSAMYFEISYHLRILIEMNVSLNFVLPEGHVL